MVLSRSVLCKSDLCGSVGSVLYGSESMRFCGMFCVVLQSLFI